MCWNRFGKKKSELTELLLPIIRNIHHVHSLQYILCDNAGENKILEKKIYPLEISVQFEYTPRDTPQHNGVVERKYQTLLSRMREMMNGAGIHGYLRKKLWEECAQTCTLLQNILVVKNDQKSPFEKFFNSKSKIITELRIFGEMGVVKTEYSKIQSKVRNKGETFMFVGYYLSHGSNVFRMFNKKTQSVSITRDVVWINITLGHWMDKKHENDHDLPVYEMRIEEQESPIEEKISTSISSLMSLRTSN